MFENVKERIQICAFFSESQMQMHDLTKDFAEKDLSVFAKEAEGAGIVRYLYLMDEKEIRKLILDPGFCQMMQWLLEDGVNSARIKGFVVHFRGDCLSSCDYRTLKMALEDMSIPVPFIYLYWRYYLQFSLDDKGKESLVRGLQCFGNHADDIVPQLTKKQLRLILEEGFDKQILGGINPMDALAALEENGFAELLHCIRDYSDCNASICEGEFLQLRKQAASILKLLQDVIEEIPQECRPSFIERWLGNHNLLSDLQRLKRIIKDMDRETLTRLFENQVSYVGALYGVQLAMFGKGTLDTERERQLIYAITHKKRHFLSLVGQENSVYWSISPHSILFVPSFYETLVNLNTLNEKNLMDCRKMTCKNGLDMTLLTKREYTFEEMKCLFAREKAYLKLYHFLTPERVDERLCIFKEIIRLECLADDCTEAELATLAAQLSRKRLSQWLQEDFGHIRGLTGRDGVLLLMRWDEMANFVPDVRFAYQIHSLARNLEKLHSFHNLKEFEQELLTMDESWLKLKDILALSDAFVAENKRLVMKFLYENGAEIMSDYLSGNSSDQESIRRLVMAECSGRFDELKYHEGDLSREISYPLSDSQKMSWVKNPDVLEEGGFTAWEEDGLLPVMQIGEIPVRTCMSYKDGMYKKCLLSCFDTNKIVIFAAKGTTIVFRAIMRLTKGFRGENDKAGKKKVEFFDVAAGDKPQEENGKESLLVFLERGYYSGLSKDEVLQVMKMAIKLAGLKAKSMGADLLISSNYHQILMAEKEFIICGYSVYISCSKSGHQYLDSLGGSAQISDEGCYRYGSFITRKPGITEITVQ